MTTFIYCPHCATPLHSQLKAERLRPTCPSCGYIQYRNPTIGVAVIVQNEQGLILLGRRAAGHSYAGMWCIPCGHVEWNEDVRDATKREFAEETGLKVQIGEVVAVHSNFHNPKQHTVGVWFRGYVEGGKLAAGDDLDSVDYFPLTELPSALAFPTDRVVLDDL
ncbi:MAG: NUDIX hydrolase [Chloroflexota bacterium]